MADKKTDLIERIENSMKSLSKGHKKIAQYIIENYDKAAYMTASILGAEAGVSESTVVRFAAELGFEGYQQLQDQIKESRRARMTSVQRVSSANNRMDKSEVLDKILMGDAENIRLTLASVSKDDFEKAVEMILAAKNIYILGMRSSAILADFMSYYFGLLFNNVRLIRPAGGSEIFEHLMKLHEGDVFIAFSFPRYTTGVVNATEFASKTGAGVIAITDSMSSPIVPHSDVVLTAKSEMASFADSLVAPLSLINAMIAYIGKMKHEEVTDTLSRLENVWKEYNVYTSSGETDAN